MRTLRLSLVAAIAAMTANCAATAPAFADPAPVKLYIYPKPRPLREGDIILIRKNPVKMLEEGISPNLLERAKDTRTWA